MGKINYKVERQVKVRDILIDVPLKYGCSAINVKINIKVLNNNQQLLINFNDNGVYLRTSLKKLGFDTLSSETQIIPVLIGEESKCIKFSDLLFDRGILAPTIRWSAVPWGQARLRLTVKTTHTKEQIDMLLENMEKIGRELKII